MSGVILTKTRNSYILDFYCSELLLAIEVDGDIHTPIQEYDQDRTKCLNSIEMKVVRINNNEIYKSNST